MTTTEHAPLLSAGFLQSKFEAGLGYAAYAATGTAAQERAWGDVYDATALTPAQRALVGGFVREIRILVSSGVWCGDCVQQCPLIARIGEANPEKVHVRFLDRDEHVDLAERVKICGGLRVPTAIFMAEDFELVALFGDRTLTRYRALAEQALGASCPVPGAPVPAEQHAAVLQEWVEQAERAHLLCRLSPRLRQLHTD